MGPRINYFFENIHPFKYGLPAKKWIKLCLSKGGREPGVLNFIFCSDQHLQNINKTYLGKTYFTDVITFDQGGSTSLTDRSLAVSGDVFISIERVKDNTKTYKTILATELKRVMIHGCLHLLGFNDSSKREKTIMREKENIYIKLK